MDIYAIFGLQFIMSIVTFILIAKWFVWPWIGKQSLQLALTVLLIPHAFRHIGLSFLVPGLVDKDIPTSFATGAAYGDLTSAVLAIVAIIALRIRLDVGITMVWIFSLAGTIDLVKALSQIEAVPYFVSTWYIPTYLVPLLLVSHILIFTLLLRRSRDTVSTI